MVFRANAVVAVSTSVVMHEAQHDAAQGCKEPYYMFSAYLKGEQVRAAHDQAVTVAIPAAARRLVQRLGHPAAVVVQQPPVQHQLHLPAAQRRPPCSDRKTQWRHTL